LSQNFSLFLLKAGETSGKPHLAGRVV